MTILNYDVFCVNEVKVYITNEAVVNCQPQDCSPRCKNNRRIMLKSYKYFEDGREMVELGKKIARLRFSKYVLTKELAILRVLKTSNSIQMDIFIYKTGLFRLELK